MLSANKLLSVLALLGGRGEVRDGTLPSHRIYAPFVQGFIFSSKQCFKIKSFLFPGEGQTGRLNWVQIVRASENVGSEIFGGLVRALKHLPL